MVELLDEVIDSIASTGTIADNIASKIINENQIAAFTEPSLPNATPSTLTLPLETRPVTIVSVVFTSFIFAKFLLFVSMTNHLLVSIVLPTTILRCLTQ